MVPSSPADILAAAFRSQGELGAGDREALNAIRYRVDRFCRGRTIVRTGSQPHESCFVISGLISREMIVSEGARQFVGMYIQGDFVDLHAYLLDQLDHDVVALTDVTMAFVAHTEIDTLVRSPRVNRLLWRFIAIDAAIQRNWLVSMAVRKASQRLGHFLCEQHARMFAKGMASDTSFELPLSQQILSDLIGLSLVHMNRSIQALRKAGLLQWEGSSVTIKPGELAAMCGFDPGYLNLRNSDRRDLPPWPANPVARF